jgi:serine/threonine-protein kinase PknK
VVVADDDVLLREGLASLLDRSDFEVVGQAGDGGQLLALVRDLAPELVVTDIRMPPSNSTEGLDAARAIREEFPDIGILVLSAHVDVEHAMELLSSGRSIGYLLKSPVTDVADFIDTLGVSPKGRQWWIPRWWRSWCQPSGVMIRWPSSVLGSWRCWR